MRAIPGIESVSDGAYTRSMRVAGHTGWFTVRHAARHDSALSVEISDSLVPALLPARSAIRRMFDLDADPSAMTLHFDSDDIIGPLARRRPGLRLPGAVDGFELAVRAVLGQQISVAAARTLASRLHAAFGEPLDGMTGIDRLPATAARIADTDPAEISALGMPQSRARTVVALARSVTNGDIGFTPTADIDAAIAALRRVPGIGPWTAEYIAMRGYQWPDAFPASDLGIRHALPGIDPTARAQSWRPWRAYAAIYLWDSLSTSTSE
jgi:AraC family transcriptional regulator of adaptative response / DNA-3-methyladenine glycosylase II